MSQTSTVTSPEVLATLADVLQQVARTHRLSREDREDFVQSVQVRLLERDYDVLRNFQGRSSLRTYLVVVCTRLLIDWRVHLYGKWRPSAAAIRLGKMAILIERLIYRDGYSIEGAIEAASTHDDAVSPSELARLVEQLPSRTRRRMVGDHVLEGLSAPSDEDPVESAQGAAAVRRIATALGRAVTALPADDRRLIQSRYVEGRTVHALARVLGVDAAPLYRRCEGVLRRLRRALVDAGVSGPATIEPHWGRGRAANGHSRPSTETGFSPCEVLRSSDQRRLAIRSRASAPAPTRIHGARTRRITRRRGDLRCFARTASCSPRPGNPRDGSPAGRLAAPGSETGDAGRRREPADVA